jgi:hypothetical protein
MASRTFSIPQAKGKSMTIKTADAINVVAGYFAYKLYEATDGQPMQWATLHGLGESAATISRAVERGWVVLQGVGVKPLDRKAALTDEGRRLARLSCHSSAAAVPAEELGPHDKNENHEYKKNGLPIVKKQQPGAHAEDRQGN